MRKIEVLTLLAAHPTGLTNRELARLSGVAPAAVGSLTLRAYRQALVDRLREPDGVIRHRLNQDGERRLQYLQWRDYTAQEAAHQDGDDGAQPDAQETMETDAPAPFDEADPVDPLTPPLPPQSVERQFLQAAAWPVRSPNASASPPGAEPVQYQYEDSAEDVGDESIEWSADLEDPTDQDAALADLDEAPAHDLAAAAEWMSPGPVPGMEPAPPAASEQLPMSATTGPRDILDVLMDAERQRLEMLIQLRRARS